VADVQLSFPFASALGYGDVPIQRKIAEPFDSATWLRPLHFKPVDLCVLS
jgi:hypothetical protein